MFSSETRLFYRRTLLQLISGDEKLFQWPEFVAAVQIDASNVTSREDNPRIWFEYKPGYDLLAEEESNNNLAVSVQSFSTGSASATTPAPKRQRQSEHEAADGEEAAQVANQQKSQPYINSSSGGNMTAEAVGIARTLYGTPASTRRNIDLVNQFIDGPMGGGGDNTEKYMMIQITKSCKRRPPANPRGTEEMYGLELHG